MHTIGQCLHRICFLQKLDFLSLTSNSTLYTHTYIIQTVVNLSIHSFHHPLCTLLKRIIFFQVYFDCGAKVDVVDAQGLILSPGFPYNYSSGTHCVWQFFVPVGHQLIMEMFDFDVFENHNSQARFSAISEGGLDEDEMMDDSAVYSTVRSEAVGSATQPEDLAPPTQDSSSSSPKEPSLRQRTWSSPWSSKSSPQKWRWPKCPTLPNGPRLRRRLSLHCSPLQSRVLGWSLRETKP